ncbi:FxsA family protein [Nonomuraea sp. SBT364]|uniref:FxsA family protein n=1 Tax=Nonomuraea sp. SBT364 TaxID=1580530 RepID=UPI00066DDFAE|nr:FxsA family protein [Nonomuraea sp. SBT364]
MRLVLFLAFLLVPMLEIWLLIQVGAVIGGWPTVGLLVAASLLGSWLIRREGRKAWRNLQEALQSGRMPERELADGGLIVVGGTLLLTPGFFSDVVGMLCILPMTRPMMRRLGAYFFQRRVKKMAAASPYANLFAAQPGAVPADPPHAAPRRPGQFGERGPGGERPGEHGKPGKVVHGEVIRED